MDRPTDQPRVFTLEAVNALVPRLDALVARQMERRAGIEAKLRALSETLGYVPDAIDPPSPADGEPLRTQKRELAVAVREYQQAWAEVEATGAVLKDPRIGLLDFYGNVDGKMVWLCWKYGEAEVTHYHGLDEGFAGRKPIGATLKQRLLN